ncbi:hypothetical protein GCM10012275_42200 [Longimycelium tulufanense]|uniref:Uncharacterized protein n=2 Tax=Longimycelium tulufanense TaxID=907463 RepID=A0A8J3CAW7_9PSEU|nr:hypothetical protein GCM10012275_42200 [Longimycelium tulufanense]
MAWVKRLAALVEDGVPTDVAVALRDPRIPPREWSTVLAREFALTLNWAARRVLAAAGHARTGRPRWPGLAPVLSLLPRHGHAVHLIRRALPFALCGLPTGVAGHPEQTNQLRELAAVLTDLLDLSTPLHVFSRPPHEAVAEMAPAELVVVTGRPESVDAVRSATTATVVGATGSCVLLVGSEPGRLARVGTVLGQLDQPGSCTRFGGWWEIAIPDGTLWRRNGATRETTAVLAETHPSAVYRLDDGVEPTDLSGYTCLPCDDNATLGTLVGFGRDPWYRWPGDFLC